MATTNCVCQRVHESIESMAGLFVTNERSQIAGAFCSRQLSVQ